MPSGSMTFFNRSIYPFIYTVYLQYTNTTPVATYIIGRYRFHLLHVACLFLGCVWVLYYIPQNGSSASGKRGLFAYLGGYKVVWIFAPPPY